MSKQIDFSKPLSEDDQAYVAERPWLLQDARLNGQDIITDDEFTVDDDGTGSDENTDEDSDSNEDGDESTEGGDESNSDDAEEDESEDGEDDDSEEAAPYAEWDYADLKEEAGNRNLSKSGSKEQLVKRLEEDDASAPE